MSDVGDGGLLEAVVLEQAVGGCEDRGAAARPWGILVYF
jgi:hypothetical protein